MLEPAISFNQAALKIEWSEKLIEVLNRECTAFLEGKPYHVGFEQDTDHGRCLFKVGLTREIPPMILLLMGDICGNLRASLDYAWMGVVRRENPAYTKKLTLPIADNRKGLVSTIAKSPIKTAVKEAEILLADTIKSHRDFPGGGNKSVIALNELSNWNKHNLLVAVAGVTRVPKVTMKTATSAIYLTNCKVIHGHVGSPVAIVGTEGEFSYEGDPTVEIVFGQHDLVRHEPVVPTLRNLAQASLQALQAFCEAFPGPHNPILS